ncbi:hypothetical protein HS088_TW18G00215 [Tripterygium wilfordii]|uniref:DUF6737 domain-containing protein n=1 Tax=Tripterygium wilfordii TaxID=458696 RepID=A0A7J7CCS4_TRIWF|nr:uncharacterized protein LOC119984396 [Tripterygium wilfordii]KAF5731536.1 hypothetical protein HS088_TW18G00215 [Tripterygium wilfordii]
MGTLILTLLPLSLSCSPRALTLQGQTRCPFKTHFVNPFSWPLKSTRLRSRTVVFAGNPRDPKESQFFNEDGVVEDMDGYLNHLSLEYDSVWDTKPSWCQPWTITLTGVLVIACSWLVLHSFVVTTILSILICAWWYIFLYSYPKAYSDMIAERRERVTSGAEDTFGLKKSQ